MLSTSNRTNRDTKRAIIVGCGRIGASIARSLADKGCKTYIFDLNSSSFERLPLDIVREGRIVPIVGDGTLEQDLAKADIKNVDLFIAVSDRDTRNAMAAQIAQHIYEIPTVVCRMSDPDRMELYNQLGIITISATTIMTQLVMEATKASFL